MDSVSWRCGPRLPCYEGRQQRKRMRKAAGDLEFEEAGRLRDEIRDLKRELDQAVTAG